MLLFPETGSAGGGAVETETSVESKQLLRLPGREVCPPVVNSGALDAFPKLAAPCSRLRWESGSVNLWSFERKWPGLVAASRVGGIRRNVLCGYLSVSDMEPVEGDFQKSRRSSLGIAS